VWCALSALQLKMAIDSYIGGYLRSGHIALKSYQAYQPAQKQAFPQIIRTG
jgi:hypothetical protein